MKLREILALLVVTAGLVLLVGCNPVGGIQSQLPNGGGAASGACLNCHTSNYGFTGVAATNQTQYLSSGHANGLRVYNSDGTTAISQWPDQGGSASCAKCHSGDGFVSWTISPGAVAISATTAPTDLANTSVAVSAGNHIACYACHNPHANWNMDPRIQTQVALGSGMFGVGNAGSATAYPANTPANTLSYNVFSGGAGNLCANCHQDRTDNTKRDGFMIALTTGSTILTIPANPVLAVGGSPHHGTQSDFLMGKDSAGYISTTLMARGYKTSLGAAPAFGTSHYGSAFKDSTGTSDSCVTCHVTLNTQNSTGQVSTHGLYLTSTATGDNVAVCAGCHKVGGTTVSHNGNTGGTAFKTFVAGSTLLADIQTAKKTLLTFFGNPANFLQYTGDGTAANKYVVTGAYGSTTVGAVQPASTVSGVTTMTPALYNPNLGATWAWKKDWEFTSSPSTKNTSSVPNTVFMSVNVYQALYNFKVFSEDRSDGIHNPVYAAELLYDAIYLLNTDTAAGGVSAAGGPLSGSPLSNISRP